MTGESVLIDRVKFAEEVGVGDMLCVRGRWVEIVAASQDGYISFIVNGETTRFRLYGDFMFSRIAKPFLDRLPHLEEKVDQDADG